MAKYGVTPHGVVIKRLDEVIEELHSDLSEGWNKNTRLNPRSYLNVQITAFADKIAELWELGEQVYNSMYPFSAEDVNLDNAVQFGGIRREEPLPTFYPLHCECLDGTTIPAGTIVKSNTNPTIRFLTANSGTITRNSFNKVKIRAAAIQPSTLYTVVLNSVSYSFMSAVAPTEASILEGLTQAITDGEFVVSVSEGVLNVISIDVQRTNQLVLSGNLTTTSVTGIVNFASEANGEVALPNGTITEIVTAVTGLLNIVNVIPCIAGRLTQNDVGLRKSYAEKIFARSSRMLESIRSSILLNVQGVKSIATFQNDTSEIDDFGRWAHSVEIVIDGGADMDIALQIWDKKTDGIQTFGSTEVVIPGDENEPITIRFNRPEYVYVWFQVSITMSGTESLPPNYVEAITNIIVTAMRGIDSGRPIIPQRLIEGEIYSNVPGIAFIETRTFYTTDSNVSPGIYAVGVVPISPRQRAVTDDTRIEVTLGGL